MDANDRQWREEELRSGRGLCSGIFQSFLSSIFKFFVSDFSRLGADAGVRVAGVLRGQYGRFGTAAICGKLAARCERTAGQRFREIRRHAGNGVEFAALGLEGRNRTLK